MSRERTISITARQSPCRTRARSAGPRNGEAQECAANGSAANASALRINAARSRRFSDAISRTAIGETTNCIHKCRYKRQKDQGQKIKDKKIKEGYLGLHQYRS